MCLIFVRNSQKEDLNIEALRTAYRDNPDGVGLLWWEPDFGWKEDRSVEATCAEVEGAIAKLESRSLLWAIHFRWATAGSVSKRNCHPFPLGGGAYMMHNGVLPYTPSKKDRSDTWAFAQMLRHIGIGKFDHVEDMLKEATRGSRMLYALPDGSLRYSGDWVHKPEGYYSNSRCFWTAPKYNSYKGTTGYTNYSNYKPSAPAADAATGNVYYRYKNTTYNLNEFDESATCIREAAQDDVEYYDIGAGQVKSMSDLTDEELAEVTARTSEDDTQTVTD